MDVIMMNVNVNCNSLPLPLPTITILHRCELRARHHQTSHLLREGEHVEDERFHFYAIRLFRLHHFLGIRIPIRNCLVGNMVEQREIGRITLRLQEVYRIVEIANKTRAECEMAFRIGHHGDFLTELGVLHHVVLAGLLADHTHTLVGVGLEDTFVACIIALTNKQTEHHGIWHLE